MAGGIKKGQPASVGDGVQERVYAAVHIDRIRHNLQEVAAHIDARTRVMAVIKADGYGHGAVRIAREIADLEFLWGYAVATIDEALEIAATASSASGAASSESPAATASQRPVLILGYCFPAAYAAAIQHQVRLTLFDYESADALEAEAARLGSKAYVHVKVDTGMGRIGVTPDQDGLDFVRYVVGLPHVELEGVFTHFARADERDLSSAREQLTRYRGFVDALEAEGIHIPCKHCANSAATIALEDTDYDVVRSGIITYGLMPSQEVAEAVAAAQGADARMDAENPAQGAAAALRLRPAMEIYSTVIHVKTVEAGTPISYGGVYVAPTRKRIATVSIGYADGYPRSLSDHGIVLIRGQRCQVVGRVCMDQMMVDVSELPEVVVGERVTVVGRDGDDVITMDEFAELSGRINYEAVCDIGKRVPRIYYGSATGA